MYFGFGAVMGARGPWACLAAPPLLRSPTNQPHNSIPPQTHTHFTSHQTNHQPHKPPKIHNPQSKPHSQHSEGVKAQLETKECTFLPAILDAPVVDEGASLRPFRPFRAVPSFVEEASSS